MKGACFTLLGLSLSLTTPSIAQPVLVDLSAADRTANVRAVQTVVGSGAPLDRAGAALSGSSFQFTTEQGEQEVSVAVKFSLRRFQSESQRDDNLYNVSNLDFVATGTSPLDDEKNPLSLLSGDSLVVGSRLKFALTWTSTVQRSQVNIRQYVPALRIACAGAIANGWAGDDPAKQETVKSYMAELQSRRLESNTVDPFIRSLSATIMHTQGWPRR